MELLSYKILAIIATVVLIAAPIWPSRAINYGSQGGANQVVTISAASFDKSAGVAPESIAVSFGGSLAIRTENANTVPLPTSLAGTTVKVKDSAGVERLAPLFFISPGQINWLIPSGAATGLAMITITSGDGKVSTGTVQIAPVSPSLFAANSNGQGVAVASVLRVRADGARSEEPIFRFDPAQRKFVPLPFHLGLNVGSNSDQVFLILYGTGIRGRRDLSQVSVTIGGVECEVLYAGPQGSFVGLDQVNVRVPRELAGRGQLNLILNITSFGSSNQFENGSGPTFSNQLENDSDSGASNQLEMEITVPPCPNPPVVRSFDPKTLLAGGPLEINGSDFSSTLSGNLVRVGGTEAMVNSAMPNQLFAKVPFGVAGGPITVRVGQCEGMSMTPASMITSASVIVQNTKLKPLEKVTVRIRSASVEKETDAEGVFIQPNIAVHPGYIVEIDGSTVPVTPRFEGVLLTLPVQIGRDNTFPNPILLQQPTGPGLFFGLFLGEQREGARTALDTSALNRSISTDNATFEVEDNTTATFPDGATSGTVTLTEVENSRTPVGLPERVFSSVVIQLTPIGVKLKPGGKLTFRNKDNLPVDAPVKLYRLDQTVGSPTIGQFVVHGSATVSADGKQVETAADAINETSYYFVAAPRRTTTVIGRVVDSDGKTPVRNAFVTARGRETFSDGNGGFALRNTVVSGNDDRITVEVSVHRPDGRVERVERTGIPAVADGVTRVTPDITLPSGNRSPTVIVSPVLSVTRGTSREIDFVASDPDPGQTVQVTVEGADFATVSKVGESTYRLRLTPGAGAASSYTLMVKATDNLGISATEKILLTVFDNRPPVLFVPSAQATNTGQQMSFTISASDPDENQALAFTSDNLPSGGTLTQISAGVARFSWTPSAGQIGPVAVNFRVTDNGLNSLSDTKSVATTVIGRWASTGGPEGALVRAFLNVGTNMFAGTQVGVYRSSDQGQTWTPANVGIENADITALAAIGSNLFAAGRSLGVLHSTDNGQSWQSASKDIPPDREITALAISGTSLFAGTENVRTGQAGVYRSANNGMSWTVLTIDGSTNRAISSLFVSGTMLFAGIKYSPTPNNSLYRSLDQGNTWEPVGNGLPSNDYVMALLSNSGFLFAGTYGNGVFRSMNNGNSWESTNTSIFSTVAALAANGTKLFAGTLGGGVYLSLDNGNTWTQTNNDPTRNGLKNKYVYSIAVSGTNLFAGTGLAGVFRSTDDGAKWVSSSKGMVATRVTALAVNGATILAGTQGNGIFLSADRGQTWNSPALDIPADSICSAFAINGPNIYAATDDRGIFYSTNNGQSWVPINGQGNMMLGDLHVRGLAINGSLLFAATTGGVFRTGDNGITWTAVNNGLKNTFVTSFAISGGTLFAGLYSNDVFPFPDKGVFRSTDNGDTWTKVLDVAAANAITTSEGAIFVGADGSVFRSTNNGDNWVRVDNGTNFTNVVSLAAGGGKLLAGTFGGVFLSTNSGESWSPVNFGLTLPGRTPRYVAAFVVNGNNLFAGTFDFGVFVAQQ